MCGAYKKKGAWGAPEVIALGEIDLSAGMEPFPFRARKCSIGLCVPFPAVGHEKGPSGGTIVLYGGFWRLKQPNHETLASLFGAAWGPVQFDNG
jgi:hypothetical protein